MMSSRAVTMDFKRPGDLVYVLGESRVELGGTEYYALLGGVGRGVPRVDPQRSRATFAALHRAMARGLVASCHDLSDGGLGVALAESAIAGELGARIDLRLVAGAGRFERDDLLLFSESQGRFVVTVRPEDRAEFAEALREIPHAFVGEVLPERVLRIESLEEGKGEVVTLEIERLRRAWKEPLAW